MDPGGEAHHGGPGVLAAAHLRRAGVVLLAAKGDPIIPDADDALDDADPRFGRIERVALLDMGFEVADIARRIDELARPAGKAGLNKRLAQPFPFAARGRLDLRIAQPAGKRPAAEHVAVM